MTYAAFKSGDFASYREIDLLRDDFDDFIPLRLRRRAPKAATLCGAALTLTASLTLLAMHGLPPASPQEPGPRLAAATTPAAPVPQDARQATLRPAAMAPLRNQVALFDPTPMEARGLDHPAPVGLADAFAATPIMPSPEQAERNAGERNAGTAERVAALPPAAPPTAQTASLSSDLDTPEPAVALPALPAVPGLAGLSESIPLPMPRPAFRTAAIAPRGPRVAEAVPVAPGTPAKPGFFEQVFGGLAGSGSAPAGQALAYANPEDGGTGLGALLGRKLADRGAPDNLTAVYDIAAHTVTLPDGTRLEAHSGLGAMRDNPYSVTERMRGATPPNVYELTPREAVFHGVRALRLTPTGGTTFGRGGLLAHTFMLGPNGDSNGCVVFRNYKAFLDAYDSGRIRRLAVVARAG